MKKSAKIFAGHKCFKLSATRLFIIRTPSLLPSIGWISHKSSQLRRLTVHRELCPSISMEDVVEGQIVAEEDTVKRRLWASVDCQTEKIQGYLSGIRCPERERGSEIQNQRNVVEVTASKATTHTHHTAPHGPGVSKLRPAD